jgi:hypothetical protein
VDKQEEWRLNGLRLQRVTRWILPRLGFRVLKGEEDPISPQLQTRLQILSPYLRDYSDYVVSRRGRLHLVEVKAPVVLRILKKPFGSQPVSFTRKEALEFSKSLVPIDVFLWDYDGLRSIAEQRDRIFYALARLEDFEVMEELATTVKMGLRSRDVVRPRWLRPKTLEHFLERSNAMRVMDIRPGSLVYN